MADIAGISSAGGFDAFRPNGGFDQQQAEEADLQQATDNQAAQEIEDQVSVDAEAFADAGADGQNGGGAAADQGADNGGAAAFNADITAGPGSEGPGAQAFAPETDAAQLESDPRGTNQQETTETQAAGNDNQSQSEANRTLGQVVDVFA